MSETRFTPEQLEDEAEHQDSVLEYESDADVPAMLRQAAQDARVIEQLRAWLEQQAEVYSRSLNETEASRSRGVRSALVLLDVLAELDRLAPPQRQETT